MNIPYNKNKTVIKINFDLIFIAVLKLYLKTLEKEIREKMEGVN